jgi:hypothetical protein
MGQMKSLGIVAIAVLVLGGGACCWLYSRYAYTSPLPSSVSARPPAVKPVQPVTDGAVTQPPASEAKTSGAPKVAPEAEADRDPGNGPRSGEVLEYSANVSKVSNVADLKLQVVERRSFLGKNAWHLQAFAHTQNPLRMIFQLDDQFDSYSDTGTFSSLQYEMHLNERGQKVDSVQRMTVTGSEAAPPNVTQARVVPGTRDPLGTMQYLRHVDWAKTPQVHSTVYDGHKLYDVQASLAAASEAVTVPAGNYQASKVEIRVFDNGAEMKDSHFWLYVANDTGRTPVLLEAVLPFATARVELAKAN